MPDNESEDDEKFGPENIDSKLSSYEDNTQVPSKLQQVFHCTTCSRQFSNLAGLSSHLKSHEEKKFNCSSCEKQFYSKKRLDIHVKIGKCSKGDRKCRHCNKVYATVSALNLHLSKLNGEKVRYSVNVWFFGLIEDYSMITNAET